MIIDACSWDHPGTDRYTGNVPAAIAAYGFPQATQQALVAAFEARQFSDRVVITRNEIRGEKAYEPDIRAMHFGSRGVICGTVTRAKWATEHVERAVVFCAGGECLAWPSVCGNLFRITPRSGGASSAAAGTPPEERMPAFMSSGGAPLALGALPAADVALVAPPLPPPASTSMAPAPPVLPMGATGSFAEGAPQVALAPLALAAAPPSWGQVSTLSPLAVGPQVVAAPIALPEPGTWLSMFSGLAVMAVVVRRRTRRLAR